MKKGWVIGAVVLVAALLGALLYSQRRPEVLRVSGFIEAHEIRVGSRVGGRVAEVLVEEGQQVQRGDRLVTLDPFDLLQQRAETAAFLLQKREELNKLQAGFRKEEVAQAQGRVEEQQAILQKLVAGPRKQEIDAARARVSLAAAELELAELKFRRVESLSKSGASTQEQYDEAEKQLKATRAQAQVAHDELALLEEGSREEDIAAARAALSQSRSAYELLAAGYRPEEVAEAQAAVTAAEAQLAAIDAQIKELVIVSPVDGAIEATDLRPGDLIHANAPAVSLIDPNDLWVRAYVPENHLNLQIGQELPITVDSFPGRTFQGRISFVARQAEFTPGNVQTPEERSKQVFRIKVELTSGQDVLRPGMSADVWLSGRKPRS